MQKKIRQKNAVGSLYSSCRTPSKLPGAKHRENTCLVCALVGCFRLLHKLKDINNRFNQRGYFYGHTVFANIVHSNVIVRAFKSFYSLKEDVTYKAGVTGYVNSPK